MSYADNPRAPKISTEDAPQESTGAVASDSLAAESTRAGGGFADNENPEVMGVKGASSTLANTETSGASVLHPAADGATREKQDALGAGSDERGASGLKYPEAAGDASFDGSHNLDGYTGGPSSDKPTTGYDTQSSATGGSSFDTSTAQVPDSSEITSSGTSDLPSDGAGIRPYVDSAPTAQSGPIRTEGELKPKGDNLTEGNIPETKTFTGDVGGPHDPGRVAEQSFQGVNASIAGGGPRQTKLDEGTGQYDVLSSERA